MGSTSKKTTPAVRSGNSFQKQTINHMKRKKKLWRMEQNTKKFVLRHEKGLWGARISNSVIRCLWPLIHSFFWTILSVFCQSAYFNVVWSVFPSRMGLCLPIFISTHKCYCDHDILAIFRLIQSHFLSLSLSHFLTHSHVSHVRIQLMRIVYFYTPSIKNFYGCIWNVYLYNFDEMFVLESKPFIFFLDFSFSFLTLVTFRFFRFFQEIFMRIKREKSKLR